MEKVTILPSNSLGKDFIPAEFLPQGCDQYYQRNRQSAWTSNRWRNLRSDEVEALVKNHNTSANWDEILVTDIFDTRQIRNTEFFGLVRIGSVRDAVLEHHDLRLSVGITNSLIISCDIGDDAAIHNVRYLSHYIIGDRCILFNISEMNTTDHAKFGNGIIKEGEPEELRVWLDLMNETGSRQVLPFDGMITADAYLWARYRDDAGLQKSLKSITQNWFDHRRGYYGIIGNNCVIKNSLILKDVKIGASCYIKGANKLKNITIHSSDAEHTQIGEGVELVNGIVGYGCRIFYGCKAVRFILGNNSNLKYGARLINSFLGDNSTISCCEVLNNLIFPAHEQHHNNSFLVAAVVMGQSNIAAGATIGSNHNSRANDNEIQAGRGFWPGLCTSLKHSSRFASFTLLSKSDYPAEMDIRLPFSLVNNNKSKDQLEIIPAYWWLYNMYALARNTWKFNTRDKRLQKIQHIEFDALAPDTVEEIFQACRLLEIWTAKAGASAAAEVLGEGMEKSRRKVVILKAHQAYGAYRDMLHHYAMKNLLQYRTNHPNATFSSMCTELKGDRTIEWVNLGGQLIPIHEVDTLRSDIGSGRLATWDEIHQRYDNLWGAYPLEKQKHAFATLQTLCGTDHLTEEQWQSAIDQAVVIQQYMCDQVYLSRKKDFDDPFRKMTYRNAAEMKAAIGTVEDNDFIKQVRKETAEFLAEVKRLRG
jgi:NDP-sugar pyrophosphorylase family protein